MRLRKRCCGRKINSATARIQRNKIAVRRGAEEEPCLFCSFSLFPILIGLRPPLPACEASMSHATQSLDSRLCRPSPASPSTDKTQLLLTTYVVLHCTQPIHFKLILFRCRAVSQRRSAFCSSRTCASGFCSNFAVMRWAQYECYGAKLYAVLRSQCLSYIVASISLYTNVVVALRCRRIQSQRPAHPNWSIAPTNRSGGRRCRV